MEWAFVGFIAGGIFGALVMAAVTVQRKPVPTPEMYLPPDHITSGGDPQRVWNEFTTETASEAGERMAAELRLKEQADAQKG